MKQFLHLLISLIISSGLTACQDAVFDSEGDCSSTYTLHLSYTRNMKWADAFPAEVTNVGVYAFNTDG